MRQQVERYGRADQADAITGIEVQSVSADGVPCEWLLPEGWREGPAARLVFLHGGGWAAGSLDSHRALAAAHAKRLGYPLLLVDYSLAPENPFPVALEECAKALAWARYHGPNGESPTAMLGLAGDSAGGNYAAAITVKAIEAGLEVPDRLLLLSAALELSTDPGRRDIEDPLNDYERQQVQFPVIQAVYVQGKTAPEDPLVSPLRASDETLAQFPPTLLQVSNSEFLLWDAEQFARKLIANGVRTNLSVWPGLPHVWQFFAFLPESAAALAEAATFLTP
jgi:acetyl esterase/lipase